MLAASAINHHLAGHLIGRITAEGTSVRWVSYARFPAGTVPSLTYRSPCAAKAMNISTAETSNL